jgi:cobalt/nickel transport system ATP-binding protein
MPSTFTHTTPGPVFETQALCYAYGGQQPALEDIELSVPRGACTAILGSNGSGKSTLLKILDGLYYPTQGEVRVFGTPLSEQAFQDDDFNARFRRSVSLVFQDSDVQLFLPSVWEEVAFAPLQLDLPEEEVVERVEAALRDLHIEKLRERSPHQLSGGEKKRVALASVLSLGPEVWLLDEPTAGLDPRSVRWLTGFLNAQVQAGKTVVLATHDLGLVGALAQEVCVLGEDHHVLAAGAAQVILNDHALLEEGNLI